jgi:hypothetical protein
MSRTPLTLLSISFALFQLLMVLMIMRCEQWSAFSLILPVHLLAKWGKAFLDFWTVSYELWQKTVTASRIPEQTFGNTDTMSIVRSNNRHELGERFVYPFYRCLGHRRVCILRWSLSFGAYKNCLVLPLCPGATVYGFHLHVLNWCFPCIFLDVYWQCYSVM